MVDLVFEFGVVDAGVEFFGAGDDEEAGLFDDVGDEEGGEVVFAVDAVFFEGGEDFGFAFLELGESDFFDLGDAEGFAGFDVFFAVGGDGLFGGFGDEEGAGGEKGFGEVAGVDTGFDFEDGEDVGVELGGCWRR